MSVQTHTSGDLTLTIEDGPTCIIVTWYGKSTAREPMVFLAPILNDVLEKVVQGNQEILLDFRKLEYMNSSTITPIIRILDEARRGRTAVTIVFDKSRKWQELRFSALQVFETEDERIQIRGGEV